MNPFFISRRSLYGQSLNIWTKRWVGSLKPLPRRSSQSTRYFLQINCWNHVTSIKSSNSNASDFWKGAVLLCGLLFLMLIVLVTRKWLIFIFLVLVYCKYTPFLCYTACVGIIFLFIHVALTTRGWTALLEYLKWTQFYCYCDVASYIMAVVQNHWRSQACWYRKGVSIKKESFD